MLSCPAQPSLRGSHDNPGNSECLFGEVEDVLATWTRTESTSHIRTSKTAVVVIEGELQPSNIGPLERLSWHASPSVHFVGLDHFSVLAPASSVIAEAVVADTATAARFDVTPAAITGTVPASDSSFEKLR